MATGPGTMRDDSMLADDVPATRCKEKSMMGLGPSYERGERTLRRKIIRLGKDSKPCTGSCVFCLSKQFLQCSETSGFSSSILPLLSFPKGSFSDNGPVEGTCSLLAPARRATAAGKRMGSAKLVQRSKRLTGLGFVWQVLGSRNDGARVGKKDSIVEARGCGRHEPSQVPRSIEWMPARQITPSTTCHTAAVPVR